MRNAQCSPHESIAKRPGNFNERRYFLVAHTRRGETGEVRKNEKERVREKRGAAQCTHAYVSRTHLGLFPQFFLSERNKGTHHRSRGGGRRQRERWGAPFPIHALRARARVLTCPFQHPSLSFRVWPGDESPHGSVKGACISPSSRRPRFSPLLLRRNFRRACGTARFLRSCVKARAPHVTALPGTQDVIYYVVRQRELL